MVMAAPEVAVRQALAATAALVAPAATPVWVAMAARAGVSLRLA
jgi:hypothetical protein